MTTRLSPQDALVAVMVTTSSADHEFASVELETIVRVVETLPAFAGYDPQRIRHVSGIVLDLLEAEDGLDAVIGLVDEALVGELKETAYALACDIAAADGRVPVTESRWLELLCSGLRVDRLAAAAIERAARARHLRVPQSG